MLTTIHLAASDQLLTANMMPSLASGDVNSVRLHVDSDMYWSGYTKSAVFFTSNDLTPVEVLLDNEGECIVPPEVLVEPCMLCIGIRGIKSADGLIKTTSIVKCKVREGTPTNIVAEPTLDLYHQLLKLSQETKEIAQSVRDDADNGALLPQKGVDYWTEEDKAEIKAYVDDAILNGEW